MVMASVLKLDALGMPPQLGVSTPDEKDAYIIWLKSEFAAANAIIDSMCQHVRSIGSPGEYDTVFSCLNRRRHAWTPTLYMQHFFSVAEIVNSLQEVAQYKHRAFSSFSLANVNSDAQHVSCQAPTHQQSNSYMTTLGSNTKLPRCQQQQLSSNLNQIQESTTDVSEDVVASPWHVPQEAGEVEASHLLNDKSARTDLPLGDNKTPSEEDIASSSAYSSRENKAKEQASLLNCEGLDAKKLLNMEVAIAPKEEETRQASIKRSMKFQCCELVNGQLINDGESGELCESVFNSREVDEFVDVVSQLQAAGRRGALGCAFSSSGESGNKPDIIRFGPEYHDGARANDNLCMPKFLQAMVKWLTSCGILSVKRRPDSCFISIFNEGDYELPNTDQGAWERPLCVISLSGDCTMVFGHFITTDQEGSWKGPFQVALPAGSVLLLQENFAGIIQKAVPASPSRRIIITLGKATSTSVVGGRSFTNAEGKARNKQWWGNATQNGYHTYSYAISGTSKQAGCISMHHTIPHHLNGPALPSIQPIFPFLNPIGLINPMEQGWSDSPSKLQSSGTGVFFPSASAWQSGLLVSLTAGREVRKPGHPKRGEKHAKVRGSFEPAIAPKMKLTRPSLPHGRRSGVTTST